MPIDRGGNGGINGPLIDVTGGPTFYLKVAAWEVAQGVNSLPVAGRGDSTAWVPTIGIQPGGTVVISGEAQFAQPPTPADFQGRTGTITEAFDKTATYTTPVRIDRVSISLAKLPQDGWKVTLTGTVTGFPTIAGFTADAPAAVGAEAIEKELFSGLTKTSDPRSLIDEAARTFIVRPIANTDAAENTKLTALIAAAVAPFTGAKVKYARLEAGRMVDAAFFTLAFSRTDTEEDVVNPATSTTVDANDLESAATAAGVSEAPTAPGGNFVERTSTTRELHDGADLTVKEYGLRDTVDDVEMPGTITKADPLSIDSSATSATVFTTSGAVPPSPDAPLTELQAVETAIEELNRVKSVKRTVWDVLNSEQKRTYPKIHTTDDAHDLTDDAVRAEFWNAGDTPPALPSEPPTNNVKLIDFDDVPVTPAKNMRVWLYGPLNSRDKQVLPHVETEVDPEGLESSAIRAGLDGDTITDPAGYVLRGTLTRGLTVGLGVNRTLTIKKYGLRSTAEDITMPGTQVETDPDDLAGKAQETFVYDTAGDEPVETDASITPPTDTKVIAEAIEELNRTKSKKVIRWGVRTEKEEIEWLKSRRTIDAGANLREFAVVVEITNNATPEATGNNPDSTNLSLFTTDSHKLTDTQWVHAHEFRPFTSKEELEEGVNATVDDPAAFLVGDDVRCLLTTNTAETAPTIAGRACVKRRTQKVSKTEYQHTYWYDFRDNAAKLEADQTETKTDTSALESTATTADVWTVATGAPTTPSLSGFVLRFADDVEVANPLYRLRVYRWGLRTTKQDIEFLQSRAVVEAGQIDRKPVTVTVTSSSTPGSGTNPDSTNLSLYDSTSHQVTASQWVHVFQWAPLTALEAMSAQREKYETDPTFLGDEHTRVLYGTTATPATDPGVTGQVHFKTNVQRVGKAKFRYTYEYRYRTSADELVADRTTKSIDPQGIDSEQVTAAVHLVASPPGAPSLTGYKLVSTTTLNTANPLYAVSVYKWALRNSKERIEWDGSFIEFDQFQNISKREVTVLTTASTLQTLAEGLRTAYKNDPTFDRGRVQRLADDKVIQTIDWIDEYEIFDAVATGGFHEVPCVFNGANVNVYVGETYNAGGIWYAKIVPQMLWYGSMRFSIRRRVGTSTFPLDIGMMGSVNNDSFLGFPAGYVSYVGARPRSNRSVDAPHVMDEVRDFVFTTEGVFVATGVQTGWVETSADLSAITPNSWVDISTFGWTGGGVTSYDYTATFFPTPPPPEP